MGLPDRILEAATGLFAEQGYDRTSMRAIADRVSITAPGLYYYFSNKQALLFTCLDKALRELLRRGEAALNQPGLDACERLRAFTRAHVTMQIQTPRLTPIYARTLYGMEQLSSVLTKSQRNQLMTLQGRHLENLRRILREGQDTAQFSVIDITPTAFAIIGMGEHVVSWFNRNGRLSIEELADLYAKLAVRMVGVVD
jgi:AcrR family transcriptional regulator